MKSRILYETHAGETFSKVAERCQKMTSENRDVEFNFNGITCFVSTKTNLDHLFRDYMNAHSMNWKYIGPDCEEEYPEYISAEIKKRKEESERRQQEATERYAAEERAGRERLEKKTAGISFLTNDQEKYDSWKAKNTDPYGAATFEYAEFWAKLMQVEINNGKSVADCAKECEKDLYFLGITGFMYGMAVSILSACWKHGEELRVYHNKEYGHEGSGVVNPAVLTIKSKE